MAINPGAQLSGRPFRSVKTRTARTSPGVLRAVDASEVTRELWNSDMNPADQLGYFAKFCPPTVANGRVYMATFAPETGYPAAVQTAPAHIVVYGLFGRSGRAPAPEYHTSVSAGQ